MRKAQRASVGRSFESVLEEPGTLTETAIRGIKRVIAFQLSQAMKEQALRKSALAKRMHTSRSQVDRVLDPENTGVTLEALMDAAEAIGQEVSIELR